MEAKESNKQSQYEIMTGAPIGPLILKMAIPTVISMLVTQIYNMADTAFVGRLGNSASAAVGVVLARLRGLSGIQEAQPAAYILVLIPAFYYAYSFFKKLPKQDRI